MSLYFTVKQGETTKKKVADIPKLKKLVPGRDRLTQTQSLSGLLSPS